MTNLPSEPEFEQAYKGNCKTSAATLKSLLLPHRANH